MRKSGEYSWVAPLGVLPNVYGLECSLVANESNKQIPWNVSVHESYFYVPQICLDIKQTLGGVSPASVVNRVSTGNQAFQMKCVPAPESLPLQPGGTRLPKEVPADG